MKIRLHVLAALAAAPLSFPALADCVAAETAAAPAQSAAPAVPAPAASPVAAATPVASKSVAAPFVIPRAVTLRDRPKTDSAGSIVAPSKKQVRLEHSISNSEGNWWYVTASGLGGGWVQESEMGSPQKL